MELGELVEKYSKSGPRYTSYPTAPQWRNLTEGGGFEECLLKTSENVPFSLYVHIPYCESLCYYCGCNIQITKDRSLGPQYVDTLLSEMALIRKAAGRVLPLHQISLGGGTPTFLPAEELVRLYRGVESCFAIGKDAEVSIEVDPRVTTEEHLLALRGLGFNRISLGVQDFDPRVQEAIHRVQSAELTYGMLLRCRELGFEGINYDLVYGLPFQTLESFERTLNQVLEMKPDRIALYNYARLPEMIPHQKILEKFPMPESSDRLKIFLLALERLTAGEYAMIGMDHFALKTDELYRAIEKGSLYRNFMGYTVKRGNHLLGIGVSAISEFENAYFQNKKSVKEYADSIEGNILAHFRGCALDREDLERKWIIQRLMCQFELVFSEFSERFGIEFTTKYAEELLQLKEFVEEGILETDSYGIRVTPLGRLFVRNIAMAFDAYLKGGGQTLYSKTV